MNSLHLVPRRPEARLVPQNDEREYVEGWVSLRRFANAKCPQCVHVIAGERHAGMGFTTAGDICTCVFEGCYHDCLRACRHTRPDPHPVRQGMTYSLPDLEFVADFFLATRRALDDISRDIYDLHGMGIPDLAVRERVCVRHHIVLTIEQFNARLAAIPAKVGRACLLAAPYPIIPGSVYTKRSAEAA